MTGKLSASEVDDLVERYRAGESQNQLAAAFGISQSSVGRWIEVRGARISRAEAEARKWAAMTADARARQVAAAHDAVRGATRTDEDLAKRAISKQRNQSHATVQERRISALVAQAGHDVVLQQAVGPYNLDLAVDGAVAVELFGGGWHAHGRHLDRLPKRTHYLADRGWHLLVIWTPSHRRFDVDVVAQDVVAFTERTSLNPSERREYRVIWGDGELHAAGSLDDDEIALVPASIAAHWHWPAR